MFGFLRKKFKEEHDPEIIMAQYLKPEEIEKIKKMDATFDNLKVVIQTGIESTENFILSIAEKCPAKECPVKMTYNECNEECKKLK